MIRVINAIFKRSVKEFLIYRSTSIITFILALSFFIIELITGYVYFDDNRLIKGWSENEYFILIAFINSATYIYNIFFILGHEELSENILSGNLDYYLIRPISSYWSAAGKSIDIPSIFNFFFSFGTLLFFLYTIKITLLQFFIICCLLILTAFMIFILNQICLSMLFWFNGLSVLGGVVEDFVSFASRPRNIFPVMIQNIFIYVVPILLMTNIPIEYLKYGINGYLYYYLLSIIVLFLVSKIQWRYGIKQYASAN